MKRRHTAEETARYKRLLLFLPKTTPKGWSSPHQDIRFVVSEKAFCKTFEKADLRVVFLSAGSIQVSLSNTAGQGLTDEDIEATKTAFFPNQAMEVSEPLYGVVYFLI